MNVHTDERQERNKDEKWADYTASLIERATESVR